jgi:hypothetical protein
MVAQRNSNTLWGKYSAVVDSGLSRKVDSTWKADCMSSWLTGSNLNELCHDGGEGGIEHVHSELSTCTQPFPGLLKVSTQDFRQF